MKILYGVQGTGNGHISRSKEIVNGLKQQGHDVFVLVSGRKPDDLWDMETFEPYRTLKGLTFVTQNGKLKPVKTALNLDFITFYKDIQSFDASAFDICITDYEPITSKIARKFKKLCIGIGHQYAFYFDIPRPKGSFLSFQIMKLFAPADIYVGLHWHHFNQPILPPVIPKLSSFEKTPNKILVYLPFEDTKYIKQIFQGLPFEFYIYEKVEKPKDEKNIHSRPFSRPNFLNDLLDSAGVICNSGFELPSEALHMGKRLLVKPLKGQIEQAANAIALNKLNLATVFERPTKEIIQNWMNSPCPASQHYPDTAAFIVDWITQGNFEDQNGFKNLWPEKP